MMESTACLLARFDLPNLSNSKKGGGGGGGDGLRQHSIPHYSVGKLPLDTTYGQLLQSCRVRPTYYSGRLQGSPLIHHVIFHLTFYLLLYPDNSLTNYNF